MVRNPWNGLVVLVSLVAGVSASAEEGWKNESQAGVVLTSGNTDVTTLSFAQATNYEFNRNILRLFGNYLYQESDDVISGKNWRFGLRYERELSERVSLFAGQNAEGDLFSGIRQRYNTDAGAKYFIRKEDRLNWFVESGYRYTKENLLASSQSKHFGRVYTEIEKKANESVSAKYWIEYLPNFTIANDWLLNTELSLSAALSTLFSVKSAVLVRYDNQVNAPGLEKTDRTFTTSLVAKF